MMMNAAPTTTTKAPTTVSVRSYAIHRGVIRLSTTFDCWKKSCHGATVVPTMATMSRAPLEVRPPWMPGTRKPWSTGPRVGWASTTSGTTSALPPRMRNISRSQVENLPVTVMPTRKRAPMGTAM